MQMLFEWSEYPCWETRGIWLTAYVGTRKFYLNNQNTPSKKLKTLDLPTTRNIQRLFEWSEHPFWEVKALNSLPIL